MARAYKGVRLKKNCVYSVQDLMDAYKVTQNTVSNWVGAGLPPSDSSRPYVFRGSVVTAFHHGRRARKHAHLRHGEFKCVACKMAVFPERRSVSSGPAKSGALFLSAVCPECSASVHKLGTELDLAVFNGSANPDTSKGFAHEGKREGSAGIGIDESFLGTANDRIIYKWQTYAGKYSEPTTDRHLGSIRFLEEATGRKSFERLTESDVEKCRSALKEALRGAGDPTLSKSTVQHHSSQIRAFLEWLLKQDGFKRLPRDLPEYIALPKAAYAASIPREARAYPRIDEAAEMLKSMPDKTLIQRRNRAIFALAFLGALRADTLISLRFGDIDRESRHIIQNGQRVRTKNGKSLVIVWFPIPIEFEETVKSWCDELIEADFEPEDALFPEARLLETGLKLARVSLKQIPVMRSKHAVTQAFKIASADCAQAYSPHAAKHTIADERGKRPLTDEQRRAWSLNMGHESEHITETHYAKMSDDRRFDVIESISVESSSDQTSRLLDLNNEELGARLRELLSG
jgi:integrase